MNGPSDNYSSISQVDRLANEPEKIKLWREEQKEMLTNKGTVVSLVNKLSENPAPLKQWTHKNTTCTCRYGAMVSC